MIRRPPRSTLLTHSFPTRRSSDLPAAIAAAAASGARAAALPPRRTKAACSMRRVVVTGLGLVTPLGSGVNQVWDRLINGKSGLRSIQSFDVSDLPAKIAGQVPLGDKSAGLFNADDFLEPKDQRKLDRFIVFGMAAAQQARSEE